MFYDKNKILSKKIFVLKFYFATIISVRLNTFNFCEKGKDPDPDPGPGGPKTYGSRSGSGTLA
jgi:hypothetical protein